MQDYLVRDEGADEHAIVEAPTPLDAAQRYIGIGRSGGYTPDPYNLRVFPITRKNKLLESVDPLGGDRG